MDEQAKLFNQHQPELVNLAYGMMGNLADARDIVQDAWLRWDNVELGDIKNPAGYLKTIVSRLCIDQFRSAKNKREAYVGPWLPEPVLGSSMHLPDADIELDDKLTIALLHILENLSADQRAIYLLHDVFGYSFSEIADLLGKTSAACRKAAQRARARIQNNDLPETTSAEESRQVINDFIAALRSRDMDKLQSLLIDDIVMYSDGGGKAVAAPKPIENLKKVSKFLMSIAERNESGVLVEPVPVNKKPGFKVYIDEALHSVWSFDIIDSRIRGIYSILNPSKLLNWQ